MSDNDWGLRISVLTRDPGAVALDHVGSLSLLQGDVRHLPEVGSPDFIVHGAAASSAPYGKGDGDPAPDGRDDRRRDA